MHFDFTITLGQVVTICVIAGGFLKLYGPLTIRIWEHDLMWEKFAADNGISSGERVTARSRARGRAAGAGGD